MELPGTLSSNAYDFAFCPEPCYDRLADLDDPEHWGPATASSKTTCRFLLAARCS